MSTKTKTRRAPARKTPAPRRYPEVVKTPADDAHDELCDALRRALVKNGLTAEIHLHPNVAQFVLGAVVVYTVQAHEGHSLEPVAKGAAASGLVVRRFDSTGKEIPSDV